MSRSVPINVVKKVWDKIAPLQLADKSWDNVGLLMEAPFPSEKRKVMLAIDLTPAVCAEALAAECSVVIAYHPPIFRGLKSMNLSNPLQASLLKLSAKGISVFSPHTSLDATPNGINTWLVEPFKSITTSSSVIEESPNVPEGFEGAGMGRFIKLSKALQISEIVEMVKKHLGVDFVQIATPATEKPITSIAACAGSGGSVLGATTADLFLTGEMSHHEVLSNIAAGRSVLLANHSNTERPYLSAILQPWLEKLLNEDDEEKGWEVFVSKTDADPLRTV